jgi:hypothetical protein
MQRVVSVLYPSSLQPVGHFLGGEKLRDRGSPVHDVCDAVELILAVGHVWTVGTGGRSEYVNPVSSAVHITT